MNSVPEEERKQKQSEMMNKLKELKSRPTGSMFPPIDSLTEESANEAGLSLRAALDSSDFPDKQELERLVLNNQ